MSLNVLDWALNIALAAVALAMLACGWRLLRGPTLPDRILALDTLTINAVALAVLYGLQAGSALAFEAALIVALLGFVSTVALARFVTRGDVME
ncbi:K+/H+ antiporter subunit F [Azohydromonas lata]|uniref:K+/H+ antiporter subunit F n=1 Tax=Azohydromonas lata TaxID=45677 RepID=A0ABU5IBP3_9BURK|nr:K+/H+ antiporter subunit F [Azohydromonas lata]MDZ5456021.1 K+/H+ antiporter subunit F [Azohydromonas lata]